MPKTPLLGADSPELGLEVYSSKWVTFTCIYRADRMGLHTEGLRPPENQGGGDAGART